MKKNKYINEAEIEHKERLEKRNVLGTNSKPIVYVDADYNDVHITTIDPSSERGYHLCCKNFDEAASYIPMC